MVTPLAPRQVRVELAGQAYRQRVSGRHRRARPGQRRPGDGRWWSVGVGEILTLWSEAHQSG